MGLGKTVAFISFMMGVCLQGAQARAISPPNDKPHLHFDYRSNCAVFDIERTPASRATWSGDCLQGMATGRGIAVFTRADQMQETVSATFVNGRAQDGRASIKWSDGAHYEGEISSGMPDGAGVLTRSNGDRFEGSWKQGSLNGRASVVWANGDRFDGDFVAGRADGHGIQTWANGDRYDGTWLNDLPNGTGTITRKGASPVVTHFIGGKRQAPALTPAAAAVTSAPREPTSAVFSFLALSGKTLSSLDGSSVSLETEGGGMLRTIVSADGRSDKAVFNLLNDNLGTISTAADSVRVIGFFRTTDSSMTAEYSDGRTEHLSLTDSGGLTALFTSASGQTACVSWYPKGHLFSADERKAAVSAYAQRLGVALAVTPKSALRCAPQMRTATAPKPEARLMHPVLRQVAARTTLPPYKLGDSLTNLEPVPVRESIVHAIDPPASAIAIPNGSNAATNEAVASNCLKVDSDGSYWGFRNHCGYSVQFAYCLLRDAGETASCGAHGEGAAPGSVAASGFSALFADRTLSGGPAEHDFRWVACRGGAGEVEARLDIAEPAAGRCLQRSLPHQQQASN